MLQKAVPLVSAQRAGPGRRRPRLGLIGAGAFGTFCLPHLAAHFDVAVFDPRPERGGGAARYGARRSDLATAAARDIVVLAVPWRALADVATAIAPHLKPGALVVETCSIKLKPLDVLTTALPGHVAIVGTHPLFGPQSGRAGIAGLNIAVCDVPGHARAATRVARFLGGRLGLNVIRTTPEAHDRQMAYVQGLTHLLGRTIAAMEVPQIDLATTTWQHLMEMVETVCHDSDELYATIAADNPYAATIRAEFMAAFARTVPAR